GWNPTSRRRAARAIPDPIRLWRTDTGKHPVNKSPARQPMMEEFTAHSKSNQFKPLFISCAVTNARLLRSTGLRSALSPSRRRPRALTRAKRVLESVQRGGKRRQLNVAKSQLQIEHSRQSANAALRGSFAEHKAFQDASSKPPRTNGCSIPRPTCADCAPARLAALRTRSSRLVKGVDVPAFRWKSALPLRYFLRSSIRSTSETLRFPSPTPNRKGVKKVSVPAIVE